MRDNTGQIMQLYYASRDGQARKIAIRIAERLARHGVAAPPVDLAAAQPSPAELAPAGMVVVTDATCPRRSNS